MFSLDTVTVTYNDTSLVRDVSMTLEKGEVHYLMGPNGSGKSSLALGLMGYPGYQTTGKIVLDGQEIQTVDAHKRARQGLFLSMQYPPAITGVTVLTLLKNAYQALGGQENILAFQKMLHAEADALGIDRDFLRRNVNDGFSGGEKKRLELLQLAILKPKVAILDEPDSGVDVDGIQLMGKTLRNFQQQGMTILVITHYAHLGEFLPPDHIQVMKQGAIVTHGDKRLMTDIQQFGFEAL